jgi:aryl-alcohol dehydrogenase-like predicted oxidoreductase
MRVTELIFNAEPIGAALSPVEGIVRMTEARQRGIRFFDAGGSSDGEHAVGAWRGDDHDSIACTTIEVPRGLRPWRDRFDEGVAHARERLEFELAVVRAPKREDRIAELVERMTALTHDGTVRAWGCRDVDERALEAILREATRLDVPPPAWVQNDYNLLRRGDEEGLLQLVASESLGYTARTPLAGGVLAGTRDAPDDEIRRKLAALDRVARDVDSTPAALALWWLRWHPWVTATLVAPRSTRQWEAIDAAGEAREDSALWTRIDALFS